jgi:hypothetical protein
MVKGSKVTINKGSAAANKAAYCACMKASVIASLTEEGLNILANQRYGKLKTDIAFRPGAKNWGISDVVAVTIPELAVGTKLMRVREIQYNEDIDTYSLEEDVGTI